MLAGAACCTAWRFLSWDLFLNPPLQIVLSASYHGDHNAATRAVIATLATCVKQPVISRPTECWHCGEACVALTLETSVAATLALQPTAATQRHSAMPFGMNAVRTVCPCKCYFTIWMQGCGPFIGPGKRARIRLSALLFF